MSKNECGFTPLRNNVNRTWMISYSFVFSRVQLVHKGVQRKRCRSIQRPYSCKGAKTAILRVLSVCRAASMAAIAQVMNVQIWQEPRGAGVSEKRQNSTT